ncbi:MAG: hypothetical protein KY443_07015 [Actinobacteria bacterium]|nr:hypothetical protein [Actinomycetota bacterium]
MARAATSLVASLERSLEALHGLRVPDFEILDHLVTAGKPQVLSELSKQVWLSRSGTRLRVRLLAASGYVTIGEASSPRDGLLVSVTEAGVDAHARALATVADVVAGVV